MTTAKMRIISKYPLWTLLEYLDYVDRCLLSKTDIMAFLTWLPLFTTDQDFDKMESLPIPKPLYEK